MTTVAAVNLFITSSLVTKRTQHSTAHTQSPETGNAVHSTPANCSSFTSLISSHCLFVFYFFRLLFFVGGRFSSKKKTEGKVERKGGHDVDQVFKRFTTTATEVDVVAAVVAVALLFNRCAKVSPFRRRLFILKKKKNPPRLSSVAAQPAKRRRRPLDQVSSSSCLLLVAAFSSVVVRRWMWKKMGEAACPILGYNFGGADGGCCADF